MIFPEFDKDGNMITNDFYKEILKLKKMLEARNIPFVFKKRLDGWQILYPNDADWVCSCIEFCGSYGSDEDLLEIMGLVDEEEVGDSVEGYLIANDVYNRIYKHYKEHL